MDYPSQLPAALQQGHRVQVVSPLMRTDLASGRARQRRRFTSVPAMVRLEWILTNGQAQLFELWYRYGITGGANWYEMPVKTALGCQTEWVRFTDIYAGPEMVSPGLLRYRAEVEIFEHRTLPEIDLEFPDEVVYADLFDYTMNRHWPDA